MNYKTETHPEAKSRHTNVSLKHGAKAKSDSSSAVNTITFNREYTFDSRDSWMIIGDHKGYYPYTM